jgi:cytoskeletal protein CcmA (bactofilin family)
MFWKKRAKRAVKTGDLTAFIDEGSEIDGKYTFSGTVMLNGKFRGEIASTDTLIVGEKGVINATINAGIVLVSGQVVGNVIARERVELRGAARLIGDVEAPVMVLEEGVVFEGHCRMTQAPGVVDDTEPARLPIASAGHDLSIVSAMKR